MKENAQGDSSAKWELWVGIFVALGSLATVAYAFVESWWG